MIVTEQHTEIRAVLEQVGTDETGEPIFALVKRAFSERRQVEIPGILTEQQALTREAIDAPVRQREATRADLYEQMQKALVDQALGIDVTARIQELRAAYAALPSR